MRMKEVVKDWRKFKRRRKKEEFKRINKRIMKMKEEVRLKKKQRS